MKNVGLHGRMYLNKPPTHGAKSTFAYAELVCNLCNWDLSLEFLAKVIAINIL